MLESKLQQHFTYSQFRPGQREIVETILSGRDVIALMPTGGGKSLCYQLPAIISDRPSLIISPLIALMKDQVDALNARGIPATFLNSTLDSEEVDSRMNKIKSGAIKIVYVAPERLSNVRYRQELSSINYFMIAVDEAHCVSAWGHDFRPDYLQIHEFLRYCKTRPIVAAFTATATPEVATDIAKRLELRNPATFVRGFDRPNLKFFVRSGIANKNKLSESLRLINATPGAAVAYTLSRKGAEELADYLKKNGLTATAYHAGLNANERTRIQDQFMDNHFKVIVATVAFGMGIDKADIRLVLHVGVPASLEGYYQEAGRAGRDGEPAYCIMMPTGRDMSLHHFFIQKGVGDMENIGKSLDEIRRITNIRYNRLEKIKAYVAATTCRRRKILEYFSDPDLAKYQANCKACDLCLNYVWKKSAAVVKEKSEKTPKNPDELSNTVKESVSYFISNHTPAQIAKIRGLGTTTIWGHLIDWYESGGSFPYNQYVSPQIEQQITAALTGVRGAHFYSSVKAKLPDSVSYEQIRLVVAKRKRKI